MEALADLRDLARGIHPPALDNGLPSALATLAASSAIPAAVSGDLSTRPAPAIETIAYFCAAELIANATKHSYANEIAIKVSAERTGVLRLEVTDDGVGGADAGPRQRPGRAGPAGVHGGRAPGDLQPAGRADHGDRQAAAEGVTGQAGLGRRDERCGW